MRLSKWVIARGSTSLSDSVYAAVRAGTWRGGIMLTLCLFAMLCLAARNPDASVLTVTSDDQSDMDPMAEDFGNGTMRNVLEAWKYIQTMPSHSTKAFWEPIGPMPLITRSGGRSSGRVTSIAVDPRNRNIIYLGAAGGGVWKTTDRGQSWAPLSDDQPSLVIGALAIDPVHPSTVYAGTGELNFAVHPTFDGVGILRTTDGGTTWTLLGEETFVNPDGSGARIIRILVDPSAPETIYVASTFGLFKSTDAGQTWVLKLSDRTPGSGAVSDLVMHPSNPAILYAAVSMPSSATNKGIYRSTDAGESWTRLDIELIPDQIGRISVGLAPSNPRILYASVGNAFGGQPQTFRLKSTNEGRTWRRLRSCTMSCNASDAHNVIRVDPANPDIVYQGALQLYRSMDGGARWENTTRGHVDLHALEFDGLGSLYVGNDGGIYRVNPDDSTSNLNTDLNTSQLYPGVALHPTNPNFILAGLQDNGSAKYTGRPAWNSTCGADGVYQAIEGLDGDPDRIWYCASQYLNIRKTFDDGATTKPATDGLDRSGAGFVAPFVMDPNNSSVLIAATRSIWRTDDAAEYWQLNSEPNLSPTPFRCLAFAPLDSENTYYAGSIGHIWRTSDTGKSWFDISEGLPNAIVSHIVVSPLDSETVYATLGGFNHGHVFRSTSGGITWTDISGNLPNIPATALLLDTAGNKPVLYVGTEMGVFRSTDDGQQWEPFSTGLPNVRIEDLVFNSDAGIFVASTHGRGMWRLNFGE